MHLSKIIDLFTYLIIFILTLFLIKVAFYNYENFQFASDVFRHFSVIRNIYEGIGPYEGPVAEYVFGVHTFFIFYLIAPLLVIFKDPKILILINITSVFISSILIYIISKKILIEEDRNNLKSLLITIIYLSFPTIFKGYFYQPYGFQVDTLATPFFLCMFYAFLSNRFLIFLIFSILILSIKEEFLLIYPALVIFIFYISYIFNLKGIVLNKKKLFFISLIYILFFLIIIPTILYYSKLNTQGYIPPFWENYELGFNFLYLVVIKFLKIFIPLSPLLLILLVFSKYDKKIIIAILLIILATILRILENVIIYADPNGSSWGNLILGPIFFISLILIIKRYYYINSKKNYPFLIGIFLVFILSVTNNFLAVPSIKTSIDFFFFHKTNNEFQAEIKSINERIKITEVNDGYIILPLYFAHPFVKEMNYVSIPYIDQTISDLKRKKELVLNSSYIILFKKNQDKLSNHKILPSKDFIDWVNEYKNKIYETENLILYK